MDERAILAKFLTASDLPRRFEEAREHPLFAKAMKQEPPRTSLTIVIVIAIVLVPLMLAIWIVPLTTRHGAEALSLLAVGVDLCFGLTLWWVWKQVHAKRHGRVRRVLHAVLDKSKVQIEGFPLHKLVLWNPQIQPVEVTVEAGVYHRCKVGELGVALFRDKHLMELVRIPVSLRMSAA